MVRCRPAECRFVWERPHRDLHRGQTLTAPSVKRRRVTFSTCYKYTTLLSSNNGRLQVMCTGSKSQCRVAAVCCSRAVAAEPSCCSRAELLQPSRAVAAEPSCCSRAELLQPSRAVAAEPSCCSRAELLQPSRAVAAEPSCCSRAELLQPSRAVEAEPSCCSRELLQPSRAVDEERCGRAPLRVEFFDRARKFLRFYRLRAANCIPAVELLLICIIYFRSSQREGRETEELLEDLRHSHKETEHTM